jgi:hypothetical protein
MENLEKYLEMEGILNNFFTRFDYCLSHCIRRDGHGYMPNPGCCKGKYYKKYDLKHPAFDLLKSEREKRYGCPGDYEHIMRMSPCEYHTLNGCLLKTHKNPVCLGFMCKESIDFMRAKHGIYTYDYLGFHYALEWILTGDFSDHDFETFRTDCLRMTEALYEGRRAED